MKLFKQLIPSILGILMLILLASSANSGIYSGIGYGKATLETIDFEYAELTLGYSSGNWSIEGRYGEGKEDDFGIELDKQYSLYGVYTFENATNIDPYVLVGGVKSYLEAAGLEDDDTALSFGFGVAFNVTDSITINAEYTQIEDEDYDSSTIGANLIYSF